jgi:hypothetical protein
MKWFDKKDLQPEVFNKIEEFHYKNNHSSYKSDKIHSSGAGKDKHEIFQKKHCQFYECNSNVPSG